MSNPFEGKTTQFGNHTTPLAGSIHAAAQSAFLDKILENAKTHGISSTRSPGKIEIKLNEGYEGQENAVKSIFRVWSEQSRLAPISCAIEILGTIHHVSVAMNPDTLAPSLKIPVALTDKQYQKFLELEVLNDRNALSSSGIAPDAEAPHAFSDVFIWPVPLSMVRSLTVYLA